MGLEVKRTLPMLWRRSAYAVWFHPRLRYQIELFAYQHLHNKIS